MAEGLGLSGSVDPTTLYTKQQCIGRAHAGATGRYADNAQAEAASARCTKGRLRESAYRTTTN